MNNYYYCSVCDQEFSEEEIIIVQNTRRFTKAWRECPICESKVLPIYENLSGKELLESLFHRAVS